MERPDCFAFGMDFLGEPESSQIQLYVEWLENRVKELEESQSKSEASCEV